MAAGDPENGLPGSKAGAADGKIRTAAIQGDVTGGPVDPSQVQYDGACQPRIEINAHRISRRTDRGCLLDGGAQGAATQPIVTHGICRIDIRRVGGAVDGEGDVERRYRSKPEGSEQCQDQGQRTNAIYDSFYSSLLGLEL